MSRPPQHKFYDNRSLATHRLFAIRLREDPSLLREARQTLERWKSISPNASTDREWTALLARGVDAVIAAIVDDTDEGQRIRQSSPLLSVLSIAEREAILAYAQAEHIAMLAAGEDVTIADDVRDLYARGASGELSSDAIVAALVAKYSEPTS